MLSDFHYCDDLCQLKSLLCVSANIFPPTAEGESGLKAPAEPGCHVPTYIVYLFKFILGEVFS